MQVPYRINSVFHINQVSAGILWKLELQWIFTLNRRRERPWLLTGDLSNLVSLAELQSVAELNSS